MIEKIEVEGWKGKDQLEITNELCDTYIVREHRKHKYTGEITTIEHRIEGEWVRNLWKIIEHNYNAWEEFGARAIWRKLVAFYLIKDKDMRPLNLDAFNGGRNRAKYYFPLYYFPMKILEMKGLVNYRGGIITRIK